MRLPPFKDDGETKNAAIKWQICRLACFFLLSWMPLGCGGGEGGGVLGVFGFEILNSYWLRPESCQPCRENSAMQRGKWGTVLALYMRQQWESLRMQGGGFVEEKRVNFQHKICRGQLAKLGCTHLK
jgi:hypothetical protein